MIFSKKTPYFKLVTKSAVKKKNEEWGVLGVDTRTSAGA